MTVLNLIIGADADDYYANGTSFNATSNTFLSFGNSGGTIRKSGGRFTNVTIENSATINSASLHAEAQSSQSGTTCSVLVHCVDADNEAAPTTYAGFEAQSLTTGVSWNVSATTFSVDYAAPDISSEVQAVVDRGGWASGNALSVQIRDNSSSTNARRDWRDYFTSTTKCLQFDIDYTVGGGGGANPWYYNAQQAITAG